MRILQTSAILLLLTSFVPSNQDIMPPAAAAEGWSLKGELREFPGAALYRHINGGAELYHQYGFETLFVQDYQKGDIDIRVEVYRFKDAEKAAALFREINSGLELGSRFGSACVLDDYQYMFVQNQFIVTVTRFEKSEDSATALEALTDWINHRMGHG